MKTRYITSFALLLFCAVLILLVGCGDFSKSSNTEEKISYENDPTANPMNTEWTRPRQAANSHQVLKNVSLWEDAVNYGANVYYFPKTEQEFGNSLAFFLLSHTNLEVTAMAPNVIRMYGGALHGPNYGSFSADYGAAVGYFVTFRQK